MSDFKIVKLNNGIGTETQEEWKEQLDSFKSDEDIVLKSHYKSKLEYATEKETDSIFYGLVHKDDDHACAILELTIRQPEIKNSGLRLLNIDLEPKLDIINRSIQVSIKHSVKIIVECITKAFSLTFEKIPAKTFKIYGRTDPMMIVLKEVSTQINEDEHLSKYLKTTFQGRWLLIEKLS